MVQWIAQRCPTRLAGHKGRGGLFTLRAPRRGQTVGLKLSVFKANALRATVPFFLCTARMSASIVPVNAHGVLLSTMLVFTREQITL